MEQTMFNLNLNFTTSTNTNIKSPVVCISNKMDEILSDLWLGELLTEEDLKKNHFTHILSIIDKQPDFLNSNDFSTKWINIQDDGSKIENYFDECLEFINNSLMNNGKIYVHCRYGVSRSPTIIIAYVMKYLNYDFEHALNFVSEKRNLICPNLNFNIALREFEKCNIEHSNVNTL